MTALPSDNEIERVRKDVNREYNLKKKKNKRKQNWAQNKVFSN